MGKYNYVTVEVEVNTITDVDVRVNDIIQELTNEDLIDEIKSRNIHIDFKFKDDGIPWTLQDDLKFNVIKEAFNKYTLEQLEEKLK
jgi:uncharacterized protein (DUF433 family)